MKILLISATTAEIAPLSKAIMTSWSETAPDYWSGPDHQLRIATTGVGMMATSYMLTRLLQQDKYDLVIQSGISGSYDRTIALADVVFVTSEVIADLGAEDKYNFLDIFDLRLAQADTFPFLAKELVNPLGPVHAQIRLPYVSALSVNLVAGSSFTAEARLRKYGAQLETMEGAALHYVCLQEQVPFIQVRSISNYVEDRNRTAWRIEEAIERLNTWLLDFLARVHP